MSNWGLARGELCFTSGVFDNVTLSLGSTKPDKKKRTRKNSEDIERASSLSALVMEESSKSKIIFAEVPVGSQSARAMASYGMCIGILGCLRASGHQIIEVSPSDLKLAMCGDANASKKQVIEAAMDLYPEANWPIHNGKLSMAKAEHLADAIGSIHAGVNTPEFQNLMKILEGI